MRKISKKKAEETLHFNYGDMVIRKDGKVVYDGFTKEIFDHKWWNKKIKSLMERNPYSVQTGRKIPPCRLPDL